MQCPSCGSIYYRKNGHIRGKQRYQCYDCGCTYTQEIWNGHLLKDKKRAIKYYLKGQSSRETRDLIGIPDTTILSWVRLLIKNISEIDLIMKEFDFRQDELGKLSHLVSVIKKKGMIFPLSIEQIRALSAHHLDAFLLLIRHRPKRRKRSNNAPMTRCAKAINPSSSKLNEKECLKNAVKIGKRRVKRHVRAYLT